MVDIAALEAKVLVLRALLVTRRAEVEEARKIGLMRRDATGRIKSHDGYLVLERWADTAIQISRLEQAIEWEKVCQLPGELPF